MGIYRVDPDRVIGVLASVDDAGAGIVRAMVDVETVALDADRLVADGRRTLASSWMDFFDERRDVPGTLAHLIAGASSSVSAATTAVVSGDLDISVTTAQAESRAFSMWQIDSSDAYGEGY